MSKKSFVKGNFTNNSPKYHGKEILKSMKFEIGDKKLNTTFYVVKQTKEAIKDLKVMPGVTLTLSMFNDTMQVHFNSVSEIENYLEDLYDFFQTAKPSLEMAHKKAQNEYIKEMRAALDLKESEINLSDDEKGKVVKITA